MNLRTRGKSASSSLLHSSIIFPALFLAAALSGAAGRRQSSSPSASSPKQDSTNAMPGMQNMPGMDMGKPNAKAEPGAGSVENDRHTQADAMHSMQMSQGHHMHMAGPHMRMTAPRKATSEEWSRADKIAVTLRDSIKKYKDYRLALADGYRIFAPNVPQPEYHFTNYENGFLESFTFNPARPTSLLYRKTKDGGWELVGAMYTAARSATLEQLNERVPLGVAEWHAHINLCMPPQGETARADWARFGLTGSIAKEKACHAAGGRFYPQVFGWMVHVYPFESSREKVWGQ